MSSCDLCGKEFKFPYRLIRHLNRVTSCAPNKLSKESGKVVGKSTENCEDVQENCQEVQENCQEVQENCQDVQKKVDNKDIKFQCQKCEKVLSCKFSLDRHEKKCKGVHSLQCPTCFKVFSNKVSKCRHIKNANCSPPEDISEPHMNTVYLLIEREKEIFKIGSTAKVCNSAKQYPKGFQLLVVLPCIDSVVTERNLKRVFSEKFIHRSEKGTEYYEGPPNAMIKEFIANVNLHF